MKWDYLDELNQDDSIRKRVFTSIVELIELRQKLPALSGMQMQLIETGNPHVLGYVRINNGSRVIVMANFSESRQTIAGNVLRTTGLGRFFKNLIDGATITTSENAVLESYQIQWLERS